MSKDFLNGLLWGAVAGGASKNEVDGANRKASNEGLRATVAEGRADSFATVALGMVEEAKFYQRNSYVQSTKLAAREATEKELLIQLADAGLSNDSRIPLANIKHFDEAYLLNLVKARQDQSLIDEDFPNGMPDDVTEEMKELQNEISQELKGEGYDLAKHGIKV